MQKLLINLEVVPFQTFAFFAPFLPIYIEIKVDTAARFVASEDMFFVIRCEQCTKRISSCKYGVSSCSVPMKMVLNDTNSNFQEVGGVTNPLISYKLLNISSRNLVSRYSSN